MSTTHANAEGPNFLGDSESGAQRDDASSPNLTCSRHSWRFGFVRHGLTTRIGRLKLEHFDAEAKR